MARAFADRWGSRVFAGSAQSVARWDDAVEELVSLSGNPVASAHEAAGDPELVLARVLEAYLSLYSATGTGVERAWSLVGDLDLSALGTGERELLHVLAARAWAAGEVEGAARFLERALLHDARDLLALKVAQDLYFLLGSQRNLRDVVERVLGAWPDDLAGRGYLCGMYAFGLEENGQYEEAGDQTYAELSENTGDVWAVHAQAHVFEMQGAQRRGIGFLDQSVERWSGSYFAVHNWWHRALYHLELGEVDEVLDIYDGPIRGARSREWLDIDDAASLLWRLQLFGVDIGDRATTLTEDLTGLLDQPVYVFNDWHAVMAAGLAGSHDLCEHVIQLNKKATAGSNGRAIAGAGMELLEAFAGFARDDATAAFDRLLHVRPAARMVGGSHAQRDVIDLTLIAAAARSGNLSTAETLLAERVERKPSARAAGAVLVSVNTRP